MEVEMAKDKKTRVVKRKRGRPKGSKTQKVVSAAEPDGVHRADGWSPKTSRESKKKTAKPGRPKGSKTKPGSRNHVKPLPFETVAYDVVVILGELDHDKPEVFVRDQDIRVKVIDAFGSKPGSDPGIVCALDPDLTPLR